MLWKVLIIDTVWKAFLLYVSINVHIHIMNTGILAFFEFVFALIGLMFQLKRISK